MLLLSLSVVTAAPALTTAQSTPVASPVADAAGLEAAVTWLAAQQDPSGAFIGFSGEPDPGATMDAVLALASTDITPSEVLASAAGYLEANAASITGQGTGDTAKLTMVVVALGQDPTTFAGLNLVELVSNGVDEESGVCGFGVYDHAFCMLAVASAGASVPTGWIDTLLSYQIENGGWAFDGSMDAPMADSNTTAIAVQALVAAGVAPDHAAIQNALGYLRTVAAPDGGFAYAVADPLIGDANSTGIVLQALIAAKVDPASPEWGSPRIALESFQNPGGAFRYMIDMPDDNLFATIQAIPALAEQPFPILTQ